MGVGAYDPTSVTSPYWLLLLPDESD